MKIFLATLASACVIALAVQGCAPTSANSSNKPTASSNAQTLCAQGGTGYWNATTATCTCNTGYTYDYTSKTCIYSPTSTQCAAGQVLINGICQTSGTGTGTCVVGQVLISGVCTAITNITEQQGCQATGGTWYTTCQCPAGMTYQVAWKSCQSFTGTGTSTTGAQQVCLASGGTPGYSINMCTCPANYTVQTQPTGEQYCVSGTGLTTTSALQITQLILQILQTIGH